MATVKIGHIPVPLGIAATARCCICLGGWVLWRSMYVYVLMHFRLVSLFRCTESSSLLAVCMFVCVCGLAVAWPRCHSRSLLDFHVAELALDDTVMAPCWVASFICCHVNWPSSTAHIGVKINYRKKTPSGHKYAHPTGICSLLLEESCNRSNV